MNEKLFHYLHIFQQNIFTDLWTQTYILYHMGAWGTDADTEAHHAHVNILLQFYQQDV